MTILIVMELPEWCSKFRIFYWSEFPTPITGFTLIRSPNNAPKFPILRKLHLHIDREPSISNFGAYIA